MVSRSSVGGVKTCSMTICVQAGLLKKLSFGGIQGVGSQGTGGTGFVDHEAKEGQGSHLSVGQGAHTGTGGQGGT